MLKMKEYTIQLIIRTQDITSTGRPDKWDWLTLLNMSNSDSIDEPGLVSIQVIGESSDGR